MQAYGGSDTWNWESTAEISRRGIKESVYSVMLVGNGPMGVFSSEKVHGPT